MGSTSTDSTSEQDGNTAVPGVGDHDRVAMLSLNADGTPDQHAPEIIGDKTAAEAGTREQFAQQATSALDQQLIDYSNTEQKQAEVAAASQDPSIAELTRAHEATAEAAEQRASQVVDALSSSPAPVAPEPEPTPEPEPEPEPTPVTEPEPEPTPAAAPVEPESTEK